MNRVLLTSAVVGGALLMAGPSQAGMIVDADGPDTATGPAFGAGFEVTNLFDSVVTDGDIGVTDYAGMDGQWAGPGLGPHDIFLDYGSSITASGVAYSQRAGDIATADKVGTIEFWFSDTDFGGVIPGTPADGTATVTNVTDSILTEYDLGGTFSGQFVAARFTSVVGGTFNPGGTEMRLTIPEPGSLALLTLGGLAMLRRRR